MGSGPAGKAGAGAASHHRDFEASTGEEYLAYLFLGPGEDHEHRFLAEDAQAVAFVGMQLLVA